MIAAVGAVASAVAMFLPWIGVRGPSIVRQECPVPQVRPSVDTAGQHLEGFDVSTSTC